MKTLYFICLLGLATAFDYPPEAEKDLIVADGEEVDLNDFRADRAVFADIGAESRLLNREAPWYEAHYNDLTAGIENNIDDPAAYYNSILSLFGEKAFPVWTNKDGDVKVAGAEFGEGRVIVLGRSEWVYRDIGSPSIATFLGNALKWLNKGVENPTIGCKESAVLGHPCSATVAFSELATSGIDVYFAQAYQVDTAENAALIRDFVAAGGGLIFSDQAWAWDGYSNPDDLPYATGYEGNWVTSHMGILFGTNMGSRTTSNPIGTIPALERNLFNALDTIESGTSGTDAYNIALNTLSRVAHYVIIPETYPLEQYNAIYSKAEQIYSSTGDSVTFCRLGLTLYQIHLAQDPVNTAGLKVAPDVATFPFEVPSDAERVTKAVTIDATTGDYHSKFWYSGAGSWVWRATGLYAAASEVVKVTLPESLIGKAKVQIGAHTDRLWGKTELSRAPEVVIRFDVKETTMNVASPYGGLIYITLAKNLDIGEVEISLENAVEAPYFSLGKTTEEDWKNTISQRKAPWTDLEAPGQISFTIPTSYVADIENATRLMTFWNDMLIVANNFAGFIEGKRPRAERFSHDIQITHGWMHSGYPVGAQIAAVPNLINDTALKKSGAWGAFHELGHNHQWRDWTISATTETGCNWWSLVMNLAINPEYTRTNAALIHNWVLAGKPWGDWSVWLALETYSILADRFGWYESFTPVTELYYTLEGDINADDRLDRWARHYTAQVGYNLCGYFQWWKWELAEETLALCATLPDLGEDLLSDYYHPTEHGDCPEGWNAYGEKCFIFSTDATNWWEAEEKCHQMSANEGHLASCFTEKEAHYLAHLTDDLGKVDYWVGLSDINDHDNYTFSDSSFAPNLQNYPWKSDQPSSDLQHCIVFYNGEMYDEYCTKNYKYICQTGAGTCASAHEDACFDGWFYWKGGCYFIEDEVKTWSAASEACKAKHSLAKLVEIDTQGEQTFLEHTLSDYRFSGAVNNYWRSYWIDLNAVGDGQNLTWSSGEPVVFQNAWCEGEPNGNNENHGAYMWASRGFCWDDTSNTRNNGYICELPANTPANVENETA